MNCGSVAIRRLLALCAAASVAGVAAVAARGDARPEVLRAAANPAGIVFAHDHAGNGNGNGKKPGGGSASSPNLSWHGGTVMSSGAAVQAIFWGSSWSSAPADKISGLDSFYAGIGGSSYLGTTREYNGGAGTANVGTSVTYAGHVTDPSAASSQPPSTGAVLAVVARNVTSPVSNGYYPVYSDQPRGTAGYCAWHSWGYIGTTLVQFAFFFKLDGDLGCNPYSTVAGQTEGLAALANVSGHELSEALTDPHGDAWYDQQGSENADKCAWTFGHSYLTFTNGTQWRVQGNWSNTAYNSASGYANGGCIDGG